MIIAVLHGVKICMEQPGGVKGNVLASCLIEPEFEPWNGWRQFLCVSVNKHGTRVEQL